MLDDPRLQFALAAVREAVELIRGVDQEMVCGALNKDDLSPVTVADYAAQALVALRLEQAYGDEPLVAEEDSAALREAACDTHRNEVVRWVRKFVPATSAEDVCRWIDRGQSQPGRRFWTLDPVDGTKGFLRKGHYATAMAYLEEGRVLLSVLASPRLDVPLGLPQGRGSVAVAIDGGGAWLAPLWPGGCDGFRSLHVSPQRDLRLARLLRSVEAGHTDTGGVARLARALGLETEPIEMDSQAKYVMLAAGAGEILVRLLSPGRPDYREKIWDQAAGWLVVEQAGGRVTDLDGKPLDFGQGRTLSANRGVVASNGPTHRAVLRALEAITPAPAG
jgi:3'(2'), 5'-bisphosphate nucleotidase